MFYWLASFLEFGDNRAAEYFIGSSCLDRELYSSVGGVSADVSHRRHKQSYYMSETRFTGLAGRGRGAERTEVVLWQNVVEIQTVMFHCSLGKDDCLSLNVTAELYWLTGAAGCYWLLLVATGAGAAGGSGEVFLLLFFFHCHDPSLFAISHMQMRIYVFCYDALWALNIEGRST